MSIKRQDFKATQHHQDLTYIPKKPLKQMAFTHAAAAAAAARATERLRFAWFFLPKAEAEEPCKTTEPQYFTFFEY